MRKNTLKILIIMSLFCILCLVLVAWAVCSTVGGIYDIEPALKYKKLTLVVSALNVCPSIFAVFATIKYSIAMMHRGDFVYNALRFLSLSKRAFYVQAGFTFISVMSIGYLEDVGPPFTFIMTIFIVSVSLTLALFFGSLRDGIEDSFTSASKKIIDEP